LSAGRSITSQRWLPERSMRTSPTVVRLVGSACVLACPMKLLAVMTEPGTV
jgi:hypothetical protein